LANACLFIKEKRRCGNGSSGGPRPSVADYIAGRGPGATKNDDGRVVYLTPELKTLLAAQLERVDHLGKQTGAIVPFIFPHLHGRHRGERRDDYRKA
jgi:hypothetical protein